MGSSNPRRFLIVASSGRALAASARRCGYDCAVLDLFADSDLDKTAATFARVARARAGGFDGAALIRAAARVAPAGDDPPFGLVYGSGFEDRPELLAGLAQGRVLYGNGPETLARAKDPFRLAALLDALGVARPEIRREPPRDPAGWLVKRIGGSGGIHIRAAAGMGAGKGRYFQRRLKGRAIGAAVVADGARAKVLGFGEQKPMPSAAQPFRFGGTAAPADLPGPLARAMTQAAVAIAQNLQLVGLNSVDFVVDDARGEFFAIEVNPRPGASLDVWERALGVPLFANHLRACRGVLPRLPQPKRAAASVIAYADKDWNASKDFDFPAWTADRPRAGTRIRAGEPICTVFSEIRLSRAGASAAAARSAERRAEALRAAMARCMQSAPVRQATGKTRRTVGTTRRGAASKKRSRKGRGRHEGQTV